MKAKLIFDNGNVHPVYLLSRFTATSFVPQDLRTKGNKQCSYLNLSLEICNFGIVVGKKESKGCMEIKTISDNLGIGTTNPSSAKLQIAPGSNVGIIVRNQGDTDNVLRVYNDASGNAFIDNPTSGKYLALGAFGQSNGVVINSGGNVGIGTTGPEVALHVNASTDTVVLRTQDSSNFKCDMNPGSAVDWSCSSDARLKTNIRDLESSLGKVMALQPRRFNLKANGKESVGFIAQEVQEVLPDMVDDSELDNLKVSTGPLVPRLVKAMQELKQELSNLKADVRKLKKTTNGGK